MKTMLSQCNGYFKKEYVFLALIVTLMLFSFLGGTMTIPTIFNKDSVIEGYSDKTQTQAQQAQAQQRQAQQRQAQAQQAQTEQAQVNKANNGALVKEKFLSGDIYMGIPRSQIPIGQEDLYIRKSQVIPPVCPECPPILNREMDDETDDNCPPCASCQRCPEPAFICKEIPSDSSNPAANAYLPRPMLTNFSEFGM